MATLKKYNLNGEEVGEVTIDDQFLDVDANRQMIKDYIVALRANARQWSASTKGRSEVKHTTKKPFRQKGTGNARQGSLVSPQYRGGGIVFGPKPKFDQHVRINKKERRLATRHLLAEKIVGQHVIVVEDGAFDSMKGPKTKHVAQFLKGKELAGKRLLFVGESVSEELPIGGKTMKISLAADKHKNFKLSVRNLRKSSFSIAPNLNGYSIVAAQKIVITEAAFAELQGLLS